MIGNDIVDLKLAKTQSNWKRKGFLKKQFSNSEIEKIQQSKNPFLQVWQFWSMKEAAYKCFTQNHRHRFFNPKKFNCKLNSVNLGEVSIADENYQTKFFFHKDYLHTIAFENSTSSYFFDSFLISADGHLKNEVSVKLLNHFPKNSQILKTAIGVPYVLTQKRKIPNSISMSHHGSFGGFVFEKESSLA